MKWFSLLLATMLAVFLGACVAPKPEIPSARLAEMKDFDPALLAREIFNETNRARLRLGAQKLRSDAALDHAAEKQAMVMAWQLEASHHNPLFKNENPTARVVAEGLRPSDVAENVASLPLLDEKTGRPFTYGELAAVFVQAWLDSPGHRITLLHHGFKSLGCGTRAALVPRNVAVVFASQVFFTPQMESDAQNNAGGALRK